MNEIKLLQQGIIEYHGKLYCHRYTAYICGCIRTVYAEITDRESNGIGERHCFTKAYLLQFLPMKDVLRVMYPERWYD